MKKREECSDRELLIRIDERTAHLPALTKNVEKHNVILAVVVVVLIVISSHGFPWVAEVFARATG